MSAKLLDGKYLAQKIRAEISDKIKQLKSKNLPTPCLAVILIGEDPASQIYVHNKKNACKKVGIKTIDYDLKTNTSEETLLQIIDKLNADSSVHGILVQLPLPKHIDTNKVIDRIKIEKDVDGFHPENIGRLIQKRPLLRPCTPFGIMTLLQCNGIDVEGMDAVIVGASNITGRPLAMEMLAARATVTNCHSKTRDLESHIRRADLLAVAIGKTNIVKAEWIKPGAIVIDIGINRLENGRIIGDIDYKAAAERASWITPVPGGVGPMTVTMLLKNTVNALEIQNKQP